MTDKEMFIKVMENTIQTWKSFEKLEDALGGVVIENGLKDSFSFSETICAYLLFRDLYVPDSFYETFWDFIYDGEVEYKSVNGKWHIISTPLQFYNMWKGNYDE